MRCQRQAVFLGKEAQRKIERASVAVIGLGALGSCAVDLLARSGVRRLVLIDRDLVEESNLQFQAYGKKDVGMPKVEVAKNFVMGINPEILVEAYFEHLDYDNIRIKTDVILDCTDNLDTRFLINEFAVKNNIPFIYSGIIRDKGYVFVVAKNGACFKCIFKEAKAIETCETSGIINSIVNIIAALQVNECIKLLIDNEYEKGLLFVDLRENSIEKIKVKKNKKCDVCKGKFEYLSGNKKIDLVRFCSSGTYLIKKDFDFREVKKRFKKLGYREYKDVMIFDKITVFKNAVLIKARSEKEAMGIFSRYIGN